MSEAALTIIPRNQELPAFEPAASTALTPMAMLSQAVGRGASVETLDKLMALQERWESGQARKAFDAALAAAKAEFPVISKNKLVDFESADKKSRTTYRHEDLGEIARTIDPILGKHGLSYRFHTTSEINQPIVVTCIVSHRDGHSEKNTLSGPRDDSGKKNQIQQMGSTITYLQRYTLKAALGLAAAADDDGRTAGGDENDLGVISDDEADELSRRIIDVKANLDRFLQHFGIECVPDLSAKRLAEAHRILDDREQRNKQERS